MLLVLIVFDAERDILLIFTSHLLLVFPERRRLHPDHLVLFEELIFRIMQFLLMLFAEVDLVLDAVLLRRLDVEMPIGVDSIELD